MHGLEKNRRNSRRTGFTLVEVMVVVAIIGVLTGIVVGIAGYVSRTNDRKKCLADMEKLRNHLDEYRSRFNQYVTRTANTSDGQWRDAMTNVVVLSDLLQLVNDPWGRPLEYESLGKFQYRLYSTGPDGVKKNDDDVNVESGQQ